MLERRRGCAARCVSDVICGCHGDAIDWPTRRQTSRESRRHSDYCPPPAPPWSREPTATPCCPSLSVPPSFASTCSHTMQLACTYVSPRPRHTCTVNPYECDAYTHTHTYTCLSNYPRIPFDNPNSCVVQRRLPLIVLSGNAIGRNFLVYAPVDAGDRYANRSHVRDACSMAHVGKPSPRVASGLSRVGGHQLCADVFGDFCSWLLTIVLHLETICGPCCPSRNDLGRHCRRMMKRGPRSGTMCGRMDERRARARVYYL